MSSGVFFSLPTNFILILPKAVGHSPEQGMVPLEGVKENISVLFQILSPFTFYSFSRGVPQVTAVLHYMRCVCVCACVFAHTQ